MFHPWSHIGAPWSPALLSHVPGPSLSTIQDQLRYEKNSYLEERSWAPVFNIVSLKYMQYPNIFHPYLLLVFKQMNIAGNCWLRLPQSNLLGQSQSLGQILPSFQQNYCLVLITDYTFLTSEVYFLQNNGKCCHPTICLCIILKNLWISLALPRGQSLLTMTWLSDIGTTTVSEHFQVFFGCSLTLPHSTSFLPKISLTLGLPYNIPPNNSGSSPYLACCSNPLQLCLVLELFLCSHEFLGVGIRP